MPTDRAARLRGGLVSLLICIQLLALDILTRLAVKQMLRQLAEPPALWTAAIHVAADTLLLVCLWLYYDSIDDRGFADFCRGANTAPLWDTPAHSVGLTVAVIAASPTLCFPLYDLFAAAGLSRVIAAILASAGALGVIVGGRMGLLTRLRDTWAGQKELAQGKEKPHSPISRVLYALVFFLSLCAAIRVGIALFAPQIIKLAGLLSELPLWLAVTFPTLLLGAWAIRFTALAVPRRRFLVRLDQLVKEGRITYTVEGHPYLSILTSRLYVGLTVIHTVKSGNLTQQVTYRVGLINGKSRKSILVLCQNQVYRILHRLPEQGLSYQLGSRGRMFHKPMYAWFTDHAFDFPEGAGARVLLISPFPAVPAGQDEVADWFYELDIGSHAFGYTVHSLGSFLHLLERA